MRNVTVHWATTPEPGNNLFVWLPGDNHVSRWQACELHSPGLAAPGSPVSGGTGLTCAAAVSHALVSPSTGQEPQQSARRCRDAGPRTTAAPHGCMCLSSNSSLCWRVSDRRIESPQMNARSGAN